jgi:TRAP-type C4-dicarboxylate transport system substrate-binding protein
MKKTFYFLVLAVLLFGITGRTEVFAQRKITFKLASLVPENTPWGIKLKEMSEDWRRITNGQVELVIYHNGVAGSEADTIRKLRLNQLQGAVLTSFGMNQLTPEILTLSCPFLIRDENELNTVLDNIKPDLDKKINDAGYFPLAWSKAGWVKIFSKTPVLVPQELKRLKIGSNPEEPAMIQAFKTIGYSVVPVTGTESLMSLNTGMIDALYQSPLIIASLQIFGATKNMNPLNIAPIMGGIILNRRAWETVPRQYRDQILESAKRIERELDGEIQRLEAEAITTMTRYGLKTNQSSPQQIQLWYDDLERAVPALLGTTFDRDTYNKIDTILKASRSKR